MPLFLCSSCDAQFPKWSGRCLQCGAWGTLEEGGVPATQKSNQEIQATAIKPVRMEEISAGDVDRFATGIGELDRVLGGGLVPGSLVLLGGEPGIGKSTLVLQLLNAFCHPELVLGSSSCLYVCGEERPEQIVARMRRLNMSASTLQFITTTDIPTIVATAHKEKPALLIVDSIQTVAHPDVGSVQGSVRQIQAATSSLLALAKESNITTIIIGHVTKEGVVAGPKSLEHLVDVVLSFEGERTEPLRMLRSMKNRFGATHEVGLFEMTADGLHEVTDMRSFISHREQTMPGVARTMMLEGSRPIPVELQVLVNKTVFGYPVRRAVGFDANRLQLLLAVLGEHAGMSFAQYDVHVNVAGGLSVHEPGADLALCCALLSARLQKALPHTMIAIGEVGLTGEVHSVKMLDQRIQEARRCGAQTLIIPQTKNTVVGAHVVKQVGELKGIL